jgi:hypothetical protein
VANRVISFHLEPLAFRHFEISNGLNLTNSLPDHDRDNFNGIMPLLTDNPSTDY